MFVFLCRRAAAGGPKNARVWRLSHRDTKYARVAARGVFRVILMLVLRAIFLLAFFGFAGVDFVFAGVDSPKIHASKHKRQQNLAGMTPENTVTHFWRWARVASIPFSISGGVCASRQNKMDCLPPSSILKGGRACIDTLLHFGRMACVTSITSSILGGGRTLRQNKFDGLPPLLHFRRRARVASITSSILGGGRTSCRCPPPFREEGVCCVKIKLMVFPPSSILGGGRASH